MPNDIEDEELMRLSLTASVMVKEYHNYSSMQDAVDAVHEQISVDKHTLTSMWYAVDTYVDMYG